MDARVKIAVEINEARVTKGWSQQKLAREVRSTQKVISKVENADTNIGIDLLVRIAGSLGLKLQVGKTILTDGIVSAELLPLAVQEGITQHIETWQSSMAEGVRAQLFAALFKYIAGTSVNSERSETADAMAPPTKRLTLQEYISTSSAEDITEIGI